MKKISAVTTIFTVLLLIARPCLASGEGVRDPADKPGEKPGSAGESLITLKIPLGSPLFSDHVIAEINGDTIRVEDLTGLLESSHQSRMEKQGEGKIKLDFAEPLKRLINVKLMVQEARNVGLDELPEVKKEMDLFSGMTLRQLLMQELSKDVAVEDKEVEKAYTEMAREWKIKSILFDKKENAKKALKAIKAGKKFDDIAGKVLKEGTAKGSEQGQFVKAASLSAEVRQAVSKMAVGSTSRIITVNAGKGFTLINLEDMRVTENAAEREMARKQVLASKKNEAIRKYRGGLVRKYVTIDTKLVRALDYESKKPGFEKLLEDRRVLAKIAGEEPVSVSDVSGAIKEKFFHGVETAIREKKMNKIKQEILDGIISKRLFQKEALLQGIDRTKRYQKIVRDKEESLLFGLFIQKVVSANVKFNDEELKAYYQDHVADYTYPGMVKLDGLVFDKLRDAESALDKLKKDADFTWIKANAEGQTDKDAEDVYIVGESVLMLKTLPEDMQKALTGAKPGDFRLATGTDGRYYLLSVLEVIPARQRPLEEVAQPVAEKVFEFKLNQAVEEWCGKLRKAADVNIYLQTVSNKAY